MFTFRRVFDREKGWWNWYEYEGKKLKCTIL